MTLPEVRAARALLAYAPLRAEVDVEPLLRERIAAGTELFLPRVAGDDLALGRVADLDADLATGWRGVREPHASGRKEAQPGRVEAALVPGVGFDRAGVRLGYGGGHFDRLLARLPRSATVVGVAFACQLVDELPREAHDVPVDVIVTEKGIVYPAR